MIKTSAMLLVGNLAMRGNTGTGLLKEGGLVRSQGRADWKYKQAKKAFMKTQLR